MIGSALVVIYRAYPSVFLTTLQGKYCHGFVTSKGPDSPPVISDSNTLNLLAKVNEYLSTVILSSSLLEFHIINKSIAALVTLKHIYMVIFHMRLRVP